MCKELWALYRKQNSEVLDPFNLKGNINNTAYVQIVSVQGTKQKYKIQDGKSKLFQRG